VLRLAAALIAAAVATSSPEPKVLFSITEGSESNELAMEPVAMVTKTPGPCAGCWKVSFEEPPRGDEHNDAKEFAERYYARGRTYRVLVGGAEFGTARVSKETSLGCVSLAASVDVAPPLPRRNNWYRHGLAVGSLHIAPRKSVRREPTAAEEKALWNLAERLFRRRGVPASLFPNMEGGGFLSTDLDGDGKRDLIGSFVARNPKTNDEYQLFLIALGDDSGGYRPEYVLYFPPTKNENTVENVVLVDTIDLDEDGIDEVVLSRHYYESHEFEIVKRGPGGKWKRVYRGGGSGC
jgi:hypothetical protein